MSKHTPRPWKWVKDKSGYPETMLEPNVLRIYMSHGGGKMPSPANAALIEASPDLLAACEAIVQARAEGELDLPLELDQLICAAIKKARGES